MGKDKAGAGENPGQAAVETAVETAGDGSESAARSEEKSGGKSSNHGRSGSETGDEPGSNRSKDEKPKKKSILRQILEILRDVAIAALIVGIVMGILYAYSGVWPPPVVIESQSMSHGPEGIPPSQLGVIDGGDMVIVKKMSGPSEIITYAQADPNNKYASHSGYQTYGSYGDVVIYKPPPEVRNDATPVIHRAVLWVEYNATGHSWDIPEYGPAYKNFTGTITFQDYGYHSDNITINLGALFEHFDKPPNYRKPHSGFITMGDHNAAYYHQNQYDQSGSICPEPVQFDWVIGVARGELPWFGGLKLWVSGNTQGVPENSWYYLVASIITIVLVPIILDFAVDYIRKKRKIKRDLKCEGGAGGSGTRDGTNKDEGRDKDSENRVKNDDVEKEKPPV